MSGLLADHELLLGSPLLLMSSLTAFCPFDVWMILLQHHDPVDGISPSFCLHDNDVDMAQYMSDMDDEFLQGAKNHAGCCREVLKQCIYKTFTDALGWWDAHCGWCVSCSPCNFRQKPDGACVV